VSAQIAIMEIAALLRSGASSKYALDQFQSSLLSKHQNLQFQFIWKTATRAGGNLALALDRLAQVFEQQSRAMSELKLAFSSPKATANLILLLPIFVLLLSELLGVSTLETSFSSGLGILALGLGLILLIVARIISLRMLERARPQEADPGAYLDAVVIALSAGLPARSAENLAANIHIEIFEEPANEVAVANFLDALKISEQSGIALSGILSARAEALRHKLWNQRRSILAKVSVSLMLPLGLAALPAFVLLAVVPLGLGLFNAGQI
jgi:tight adherence protein B